MLALPLRLRGRGKVVIGTSPHSRARKKPPLCPSPKSTKDGEGRREGAATSKGLLLSDCLREGPEESLACGQQLHTSTTATVPRETCSLRPAYVLTKICCKPTHLRRRLPLLRWMFVSLALLPIPCKRVPTYLSIYLSISTYLGTYKGFHEVLGYLQRY